MTRDRAMHLETTVGTMREKPGEGTFAAIPEALRVALRCHKAGRLEPAEQIYRRIVAVEPAHAGAWRLLGMVAYQSGQFAVAVDYLGRAVALDPCNADYHNELGIALRNVGKVDEAIGCYRGALRLKPELAAAHNNLGVALKDRGKLDEAVGCYRRALELKPDSAEAHSNLGVALMDRGKLGEAISCQRRALELKPDYAEAHNNLGVALMDQGKWDEAVACYGRALALRPDFAEAHNNMGVALKGQGRLDEATACHRKALELKPDFVEAHTNLGGLLKDRGELDEAVACYRRASQRAPDCVELQCALGAALMEQGKLEEAAACFRKALERKPDLAEAINNLGVALKGQGKLNEAVACHRRAVQLKPASARSLTSLGNALSDLGNVDEAVECHRRALELEPDYAPALNNLGNAYRGQKKLPEAIACYRRALELNPDLAEPGINLAAAFLDLGKPDEAVGCCRRALERKPDCAEAFNNLGSALKDQGKLEDAVACYRRALELKPGHVKARSNLLYTLHFCAGHDPKAVYEEHRRWNRQHAEPVGRTAEPHANDRCPDRRLRIGYVSADFREHPVGRFVLPLIAEHDREAAEVFCYSSTRPRDQITGRIRGAADRWRDVCALSDDQLAGTVRGDRIDVLVDLSMHMACNRLLAFARKPAPVQVTYLAYCGTTGLDAIDYRLTDPYLDPPGGDEPLSSERSIRLRETYWCYRPPEDLPEPAPLPAWEHAGVTFGCLNNFCKVTAPALEAWSRLLQAVPRGRLLLHAHEGSHRERVWEFFARRGVSRARVEFVGYRPLSEYLRIYDRIDVALDTFPYAGGTTTCDALWMGVPAVSLAGQTAVGRSGLSILSNVGLPELVARDAGGYVRIAAELAGDLNRLADLRSTLRDRMRTSVLMDAPRFARDVEAAYREMWRHWCRKGD